MTFDLSVWTGAGAWQALLGFALTAAGLQAWLWLRPHHWRRAGIVVAVVTAVLAASAVSLPLAAGLLLATVLIMVVGWIDEQWPLPAGAQLCGQLVIAGIVVSSGWTIPYVSQPFAAGVLLLQGWGMLAALLWIIVLINALNWWDGSDGLTGGVSLAGFVTLIGISLLPATHDARTLQLALLGLGTTGAFVLFNWSPARVYLGTTGSWFLGLYLALVAIIGGGKIATLLLVLAVPLGDMLLVIADRLRRGQAPWHGDTRSHLHHRLQQRGWSPRQIAVVLSSLSLLLGIAAVSLQTQQKLTLSKLLTKT